MHRLAAAVLAVSVPVFAQSAVTPSPVVTGATITQGNQEIHDLAKTGTGEQVKALLAKNPSVLNVKNALGASPLHLAAINPDASAIQALLAAGADVNAKDAEAFTPLHMAAFHRQADYALLLLEAGADVQAKTASGRTPLSMADKARADETAGVISLWILKGCKPGQGCGIGTVRPVKKLVK